MSTSALMRGYGYFGADMPLGTRHRKPWIYLDIIRSVEQNGDIRSGEGDDILGEREAAV